MFMLLLILVPHFMLSVQSTRFWLSFVINLKLSLRLFIIWSWWSKKYIFRELLLRYMFFIGICLFAGYPGFPWIQAMALSSKSKPFVSKIFSGIRSGWIANYVSNLTLYLSWSTSCGEKVMNMQFLITMIGIVYGKRLRRIRNWTSTIIVLLMSNLHFTGLMGLKDLMPLIQTNFSLAVCFL